ncbi:L,D-transpeptidase [Microbacterium atlanticum]|uniref:L,D-transpeptidase n=1 Tax=Microbacterium atlanticum TaxID=2782168 RepID=UPI001886ABBC|nr:L,D-transpeptidase [Microbacterium atlanticum]
MADVETTPPARERSESSRSRVPAVVWFLVGLAATMALLMGVGVWLARPAAPEASVPVPVASPVTASPAPVETAAQYPANTTAYEAGMLPEVNVFAVIPALPVDDDPFGVVLPEQAVARGTGAPVWADPAGEPVAYLPREYLHDGTTVPVVQKQEHWVKVLLTGRQAVPSRGNPAQVTGWLRTADVELAPTDASVVVSLSARTIDIVRGGVVERIATDFASGTPDTPTPLGRTFIMTTAVVPEYGYTRGHPIVYWASQSPTLDGFGGADVAVSAFHYHDDRSGDISNGCLRVDADAIARLAELPLGTPVSVNP